MMVSGPPQKDDGALLSRFAITFSPSSLLTFSTALLGGSGCWDGVIDGAIGGPLTAPDCGSVEAMSAFEISLMDARVDNFSKTDDKLLEKFCTLMQPCCDHESKSFI